MKKTKKLIIFGDSAFAEVAYEYFTHDSPYKVVAFTVSAKYLTKKTLFGLPVVPFEKIKTRFPPKTHAMFVALVYTANNTLREQFYTQSKALGYTLASYISPRASIWPNVHLGQHVFIFEDNTIQPFVTIGNNTILWSGNHIGHHTTIADHCFISSHVVVSGFCTIGDHTFLGVNSSLNDRITIAPYTVIGNGTVVIRDTKKGKTYVGNPARELV